MKKFIIFSLILLLSFNLVLYLFSERVINLFISGDTVKGYYCYEENENHLEEGFCNGKLCPYLGERTDLLVAVTSAPYKFLNRKLIRQTWGHYSSMKNVKIIFVLGKTTKELAKKIEKENQMYGDIIQGDFLDTYRNLTLKTLFILDWTSRNCNKAKFLLKTDDDIFINVPLLLAFIGEINVQKQAIYGHLLKKSPVVRNKTSKWYISNEEYKDDYYPDYLSGCAYLLPVHLAKELVSVSLQATIVPFEDVFVTGILAKILNLKLFYIRGFSSNRLKLSSCESLKYISMHLQVHSTKSDGFIDMWHKQLIGETFCKVKLDKSLL